MSNDDKRRRRDGSTTTQLSVAELLARREAETQPIPRITDERISEEQTVRFKPAANLSGRELHITELLKREGRAGEEERGGGFSVPKLVAMAGGGVVLAGTVAFTASNLLSSPDERPLAEVRYDTRPAARATNTLGKDLAPAAAAAQQQAPETTESTPDTTTPSQTATQKPRATQQQPAPTTTTTTEQAPATEQPAPTTTTPSTTTTTPSTTTTPPPPTSSSTTPKTPDSSTTTPPSSTEPSKPGLGLGLDLGGILDPIGGFDFFAPAE